jgi:hypothetical protein
VFINCVVTISCPGEGTYVKLSVGISIATSTTFTWRNLAVSGFMVSFWYFEK